MQWHMLLLNTFIHILNVTCECFYNRKSSRPATSYSFHQQYMLVHVGVIIYSRSGENAQKKFLRDVFESQNPNVLR